MAPVCAPSPVSRSSSFDNLWRGPVDSHPSPEGPPARDVMWHHLANFTENPQFWMLMHTTPSIDFGPQHFVHYFSMSLSLLQPLTAHWKIIVSRLPWPRAIIGPKEASDKCTLPKLRNYEIQMWLFQEWIASGFKTNLKLNRMYPGRCRCQFHADVCNAPRGVSQSADNPLLGIQTSRWGKHWLKLEMLMLPYL